MIESVKVAEDGTGTIVRLYDAYGSRGPVNFHTSLPVRAISRTDMLENVVASLEMNHSSVVFEMGPFEIVTLKLELMA
ncbi:MAG: glycosyl hydrolase-related protein [Chthoniobacteraceae bacterium]